MKSSELDFKLSNLCGFLEENNIWFREDYEIKYDTYFKSGGIVKIYCSPKNLSDFTSTIKHLTQNQIHFKVIGFTSNVLLFDHVQYSVILTTKNLVNIRKEGEILNVESGYSLQDFVRVISILHQAEGYEGLEGIPGSIGGAIFMNAAAYGSSISDHIISVTYLNSAGEIITKFKDECQFVYRNSFFKKESENIILNAKFKINKGSELAIRKNIERYHIARHSYQEFVYPNLGSLISINSDIYKELLKGSKFLQFKYLLLKILYKNPVSKLLKRKKPDNIAFNNLVQRYIGKFPFEPSEKSINILVNRGDNDIEDIYKYVINLSSRLDGKIKIENEFVFDAIYSIDKEYSVIHHKMRKKLIEERTN